MTKHLDRLGPSAQILLSFLLVILAGGVLLRLPFSCAAGHAVSWIDAFFLSTSAVCVTGLASVDIGTTLSLPGQWILLALIQVGGVGLMVLSSFIFILFHQQVSLKQRHIIQGTYTSANAITIRALLRIVIFYMVVIEGAGILCLFPVFLHDFPFPRAAWLSLFHSVSAFCNAGFSPLPQNLLPYRYHVWLNLVIMGLIIVGGIGFSVLWEALQAWKQRQQRFRFSLNAKIVLVTTFALILGGALALWLLEWRNPTLEDGTRLQRLLPAFFQSVTARTAGFNTVDMASLRDDSIVVLLFLMFVGASPGSCGGGIKTTTFAILCLTFWNRMRGIQRTRVAGRVLPDEQVVRATVIFMFSVALLFVFSGLLVFFNTSLCVSGRGHWLDALFESTSAISTVGLSLGITPYLNSVCKFLIILLMYFGRVGLLTLVYQMMSKDRREPFEYAEEGIMVG
ncbi:MAG: potassium transporter TrkG [Fibrobacterota bacterium]